MDFYIEDIPEVVKRKVDVSKFSPPYDRRWKKENKRKWDRSTWAYSNQYDVGIIFLGHNSVNFHLFHGAALVSSNNTIFLSYYMVTNYVDGREKWCLLVDDDFDVSDNIFVGDEKFPKEKVCDLIEAGLLVAHRNVYKRGDIEGLRFVHKDLLQEKLSQRIKELTEQGVL